MVCQHKKLVLVTFVWFSLRINDDFMNNKQALIKTETHTIVAQDQKSLGKLHYLRSDAGTKIYAPAVLHASHCIG